MSLTDTPNANRLHIALFGKRNSGKSSLINALTGQDTATSRIRPAQRPILFPKQWRFKVIGPCLFYGYSGIRRRRGTGRNAYRPDIEGD